MSFSFLLHVIKAILKSLNHVLYACVIGALVRLEFSMNEIIYVLFELGRLEEHVHEKFLVKLIQLPLNLSTSYRVLSIFLFLDCVGLCLYVNWSIFQLVRYLLA